MFKGRLESIPLHVGAQFEDTQRPDSTIHLKAGLELQREASSQTQRGPQSFSHHGPVLL